MSKLWLKEDYPKNELVEDQEVVEVQCSVCSQHLKTHLIEKHDIYYYIILVQI